MLRAVPAEAQGSVSADLLEIHRACPLERGEDTLKVALLNPKDVVAIRAIEVQTGLTVEPWVTIEYRLYQALERYYKIRFDGLRSLTLAPPQEMRRRRLENDERGDDRPAGETDHEVDLQVGLDGLPLDADLPDAGIWGSGDLALGPLSPTVESPDADDARVGDEEAEPALTTGTSPTVAAEPPPEPAPDDEDPFERLERRLSAGPDRAEVAEVLLEYASTLAPRCAVFAVSRDKIRGILGRGRGFTGLGRIDLPRGGETVLDAAIDSEQPYYGVVPHVPPNRELYSALGGQLPPTVLITPVLVRGRTVALIYTDNDSQPMTRPEPTTLDRVAAKAGLAFEILILRNKLLGI
jgi:hypothetical protein